MSEVKELRLEPKNSGFKSQPSTHPPPTPTPGQSRCRGPPGGRWLWFLGRSCRRIPIHQKYILVQVHSLRRCSSPLSLSVFGAQQHLPAFPTSCLRIRAWARLRVCECVCAVCTCRTCGIKAGSGVWGERQRRNRTPYVWGDRRTQRRELARGPGPGRIPPRHPPREGLSTDNPQAVGRAMRRRRKYLNCGIK